MKINDRVKTCYGEGIIISKEAETGFLSKCFLVKLDKCPENLEYIQKKQAYIELYKMNGIKLYNMTEGGDGVRLYGEKNGFYGKKHSDETRKHWSEIRKGKNTGEQNANYQGKYSKGENNPFYGKQHSEETRQKISEKGKGKNNGVVGENHPMFDKTGKNHPQSKAVYQIDIDSNEIIKEWESIISAEKELKIRHISDCCNGLLKTAGGFKWSFVKNYPL